MTLYKEIKIKCDNKEYSIAPGDDIPLDCRHVIKTVSEVCCLDGFGYSLYKIGKYYLVTASCCNVEYVQTISDNMAEAVLNALIEWFDDDLTKMLAELEIVESNVKNREDKTRLSYVYDILDQVTDLLELYKKAK